MVTAFFIMMSTFVRCLEQRISAHKRQDTESEQENEHLLCHINLLTFGIDL
jgi:hypothetical protein